MKRYLRLFLVNIFSLWLAAKIISGISFGNNNQTIFVAALALTLIDLLVKPIIKLLLLPINLLTLGTFQWLANVLALYLTTIVVPDFSISGFFFPGFDYKGFIIPAMSLSLIWAFIITSLVMSLISSFLIWLARD